MILSRTSASQVVNFNRCQRYWHFRDVQKLSTPKTEAQARGTAIHAELEHYLKTGEMRDAFFTWESKPPLPLKPFVEAAEPHLPDALSKLLIEKKFVVPTFPGGPEWVGYIDLVETSRNPIKIYDYKTTSDFKRNKTPHELQNDVQLGAYAHWAFKDVAIEDNTIEIAHLYLKTGLKKPQASYQPALVSRASVRGVWDKSLVTVSEMVKAAEADDANKLPPTETACFSYGKDCPFKSRCDVTPSLFRIKTQHLDTDPVVEGALPMSTATPKLSFAERLNAAKAAKAGAPQNGHAPATVAVAHTTPMLTGAAAKARGAELGVDVPEGSGFAPRGVLSPDASPRTTPVPAAVAAPAAVAEPIPVAEGAETAKRKRRTKVEMEAARALEKSLEGQARLEGVPVDVPAVTDLAVSAMRAAVQVSPEVTRTTATVASDVVTKRSFSIYIDCYPVKGGNGVEPTLFSDYINQFATQVADQFDVADPRLIDYGKGRTAIAIAVAQKLEALPPVLVISSMEPYAHDVIAALTPHATTIVRGLKG